MKSTINDLDSLTAVNSSVGLKKIMRFGRV